MMTAIVSQRTGKRMTRAGEDSSPETKAAGSFRLRCDRDHRHLDQPAG
jgi:hypothetical protein